MKNRKARYSVTVVFVLLLILSLEGTVRVVRKAADLSAIGLQDIACIRNYFSEHLSESTLAPSPKTFDSITGWRNMKSTKIDSVSSSGTKIYMSNSEGWRNPLEFQQTKTKQRVAITGDSFAFGWGVDYDDSIGPQLQKLLGDSFEVMNFAVGGFSVLQMAITSTEVIKRYDPDFLIVSFIGPDFGRSCSLCNYGIVLPSIERQGKRIVYQGIPIRSPTDRFRARSSWRERTLDKGVNLLRHSMLLGTTLEIPYHFWKEDCLERTNNLAIEKIEAEYPGTPVLFAHLKYPIPSKNENYLKTKVRSYLSMEQIEGKISEREGLALDTSDGYHSGVSQTKIHALVYRDYILNSLKTRH